VLLDLLELVEDPPDFLALDHDRHDYGALFAGRANFSGVS